MKVSILSFIFALILTTGAQAADYLEILNPPSAQDARDQRNWSKFLDITEKTGTVLDSDYGEYLTLTSIDPEDTTKTHHANYFSLVGGRDGDGKFQYNRAEAVSEHWVLKDDGNWHIDQYLFRLNPDQTLAMAMHTNMVQSQDRVVLNFESKSMDEAEAQHNWRRIRDQWYARIGLD